MNEDQHERLRRSRRATATDSLACWYLVDPSPYPTGKRGRDVRTEAAHQ